MVMTVTVVQRHGHNKKTESCVMEISVFCFMQSMLPSRLSAGSDFIRTVT